MALKCASMVINKCEENAKVSLFSTLFHGYISFAICDNWSALQPGKNIVCRLCICLKSNYF